MNFAESDIFQYNNIHILQYSTIYVPHIHNSWQHSTLPIILLNIMLIKIKTLI